jgi:hypothetical protein
MADEPPKHLNGDFTFGEFLEVQDGVWKDEATGKSEPYRNLFILVSNADRSVDRVKIRATPTTNLSHLTVGKHYGVPVTTRQGRERGKLSRSLRPDLPIIPAPALGQGQGK